MILKVKYILIVGVLLALPHFSIGQIDTTRIDTIPNVHLKNQIVGPNEREVPKCILPDNPPIKTQQISEIYIARIPTRARMPYMLHSVLQTKEIDAMSPDDVGDLAAKLPGATVKSYGGLGSLKTISFHSMGGSHTSVVLDGVVLNNSQSGQVNLAQIQGDGLSSISAHSEINSGTQLPVSAVIGGNVLQINSFLFARSSYKTGIRANVKYGSFNRQEGYLSGVGNHAGKWFFSAFGKFRRADGDHDYQFQNGLTVIEGKRKNNDYQDLYFGAQLVYAANATSPIRLGYKGSLINQGLPGAVILYNETADERMISQDHTVYANGNWHTKKDVYFRAYGSANQNNLNYSDPTYFNSIGYLDVDYLNQTGVLGISMQKYGYHKLNFNGGIEETVSALVSSDSSLYSPIRFHSKMYIGALKQYSFGTFKAMVSSQYVSEKARLLSNSNELFKVNPMVSFETKEYGKIHHAHTIMYKNTFRMPSFNELYYNNIGNSTLLPEIAHQFVYSILFSPIEKGNKTLVIRSSMYLNRIDNKIVAIPTKNLFVWSMQNVTDVNILGVDISINYTWQYGDFKPNIAANYSFQRATDVTEESLNYGQQIAYTPQHLANLDFAFDYHSFGFRFSNNFTSGRYALNENIESNLVDGYITSDISANYTFKLKKENKIKIQANVKNVFNQSYAYIRSFVMPGRNYLISLSYALN